jgi:hypothetical protein
LIRPGASPVISSVTRPRVPTSLPWPSESSGERGEDLHEYRKAQQRGHHPDHGTGREHRQDQVQAEHLGDAEADREREPGLPEVVADPVHAPTLSTGR